MNEMKCFIKCVTIKEFVTFSKYFDCVKILLTFFDDVVSLKRAINRCFFFFSNLLISRLLLWQKKLNCAD
jgi:hypothetical protein